MESEVFTSSVLVVSIFAGASIILLVYILKFFKNNTDEHLKNEKLTPNDRKKEQPPKVVNKKKNIDSRWTGRSDKQSFSHQWVQATLKGHTGEVLGVDFASNGKYLASCGYDRAVFLWDIKDLTQVNHKSLRVNIEYDHPTFIKWSPDSKAFIIHRYNENAIEVYKVEKKKDGWLSQATKALTFPKGHNDDVIGMDIASTGKFIMTCSNKTDLIIWDLKGQILGHVDTYLMSTTCAKLSPCGKFVVASGFGPDVKVWEVLFSKTNEFQEVKRVFELTGHSSGVYDVAFDVDTSHMATVSKDGSWKLFDTKIDYKRGEDPHLKKTGKYDQSGNHAYIALSPNAEVIVIATSATLSFYSALTGVLDKKFENIFPDNITSILFDASGNYLLASGGRHILIFHNVTGYKCNIETAKAKLKENVTSATRERLQNLIAHSQKMIDTLNKK